MKYALSLLAALSFFASAASIAAPKAELWPRWAAHDPNSTIKIDHAPWGRFLEKYLVQATDRPNLISYRKVKPQDRTALAKYLDYLSSRPVSRMPRRQQLPFWINFYNALTVKLVLDHYPVESILRINISPGFFSFGPWKKKLVMVEGEKISLDDIEHRILRPIWKDPRLHYVLNFASMSCPELRPLPYTEHNVADQMTEAARSYIAGYHGVWFEEGKPGGSSLYKWYGEDFGRDDPEIIAHIKRYATPHLRARLESMHEISVYYYDWSLNDAR